MNVDPDTILASSHGMRSIDTFMLWDPSRANWDYVHKMEGEIPIKYKDGATVIPGARELLQRLDDLDVPWAVVTSATRTIVNGWLDVLDFALPKTMVTAEDVDEGKPDPACYLLGRSRLGLDHAGDRVGGGGDGSSSGGGGGDDDVIVVEDSPSGVRAGKAAGFQVVGLTTTHSLEQVRNAGADWVVDDLRGVSIKSYEAGRVVVELTCSL